MRIRTARHRDRRTAARAFTLIELLVVIVVIALLIGIFVGAVSNIRDLARSTATQGLLSTLGTGLEAFKGEGRLGGDYAPSWSDQPGGGNWGQVQSPYGNLPGSGPSGSMDMTGAGLIVWALAGADFQGTPGFKAFRSTNTSRLWSNDTDDEENGNDPTQSGAYALRSDDRRPVQTRCGPYVDVSSMSLSEWDENTGRFEIGAERGAAGGDPGGPSPVRRDYPMFLDSFGFPILYWKADIAGVRLADDDRQQQIGVNRGVYHWEDNQFLIADGSNHRLVLRPGADDHRLDWDDFGVDPSQAGDYPDFGTFPRFILNEAVKARFTPHRAQSYLLVSPGPDGVYGTGDDIPNFQHNGR